MAELCRITSGIIYYDHTAYRYIQHMHACISVISSISMTRYGIELAYLIVAIYKYFLKVVFKDYSNVQHSPYVISLTDPTSRCRWRPRPGPPTSPSSGRGACCAWRCPTPSTSPPRGTAAGRCTGGAGSGQVQCFDLCKSSTQKPAQKWEYQRVGDEQFSRKQIIIWNLGQELKTEIIQTQAT